MRIMFLIEIDIRWGLNWFGVFFDWGGIYWYYRAMRWVGMGVIGGVGIICLGWYLLVV